MKLGVVMNKLMVAILLSVLASCGGGGGGGGVGSVSSIGGAPVVTTSVIGGIGATGQSIANGNVTAQCVAGNITPTTTDSNGNYSLTLTNATLPCIVQITVPSTGQNYYSIVENGATIANVTPLTHLVSDALFGANSATVWTNFTSTYAQMITPANIAAAQIKVQTALAALGIDITAYDVLKASFTPATTSNNGSALDQKLDQLAVILNSAQSDLTKLSTAVSSSNSATVANATAIAMGPAAKQLGSCPYVRGGNYWTFMYNGLSQQEWTVDLNAMTANVYGSGASYPIQQLTTGGNVVPCAFTITLSNSVITTYFSKSGVFSWKQAFQNNTYYFGLGVPVQSTSSLKNSQYAGTYPILGYIDYTFGGNNFQSTLPMEMSVDSSGSVTMANCSLSNGSPACDNLTSSNSSTMSCTTSSQGMQTCTSADGSTTANVFAITVQQQPTVFMLMSGKISGAPYTALVVGTKSLVLTQPAVGYTQNTSVAWYLARTAQSNPNSSWTFVTGDTASGAGTTVSSISTDGKSYSTSDGLTVNLNSPINGFYWTPSVTNNTFKNGSPQMITMTSNGGWAMRALGLPNATTFNNFNGVEFFIRKPM